VWADVLSINPIMYLLMLVLEVLEVLRVLLKEL
jgi:hypothetical protein